MILSGFTSQGRGIKEEEIKESGRMNSVVSFLSFFVFTLHLVMNPARLRGIVQVSFCFIFLCVAGLFTISSGVFLHLEEYELRRGRRKTEKGQCFSILKAGGGPPQ